MNIVYNKLAKLFLDVNKLDNRYYDKVIEEMQPFFDEQGFKAAEDGSFKNDKKSVKVQYDESRQMYTLSAADVEDGNIGEYAEINAWLFDDSQNAKDAASVGIDFTATLRKSLGIKVKRAGGAEVELPTLSKGGSVTITGFAKKMLDFFPVLKDEYKNHIAENGNFLYLNFFGEHLVPQLKSVLTSGNKKQIKKLFDLLDDLYVKGDKDTVNTIIAVLCGAAYNDEKVTNAVKEMLEGDKHFLSSFENFLPVLPKSKKLLAALVK